MGAGSFSLFTGRQWRHDGQCGLDVRILLILRLVTGYRISLSGQGKDTEGMARTIKIDDDLHRDLGRFGNRDESWNDVVARVLAHVDEDAALQDRNNRTTTHGGQETTSGKSGLEKLPDGTVVRHAYSRGEYSGHSVEATVVGDRLSVEGDTEETRSPTGAARVADEKLRGDDARGEGYNGWTWWTYQDENGEWRRIQELGE